MDFPVCNHTLGVTENNIGYVSGILDGEIPFEAELFQYGENNDLQKEISVLMPIIKNRSELDCTQNNKGNVIGFEYEIEINSYTTFDKDDKGNLYVRAGVDVDSNPGNAIPGDKSTYEDDTDSSPSLKLELGCKRINR